MNVNEQCDWCGARAVEFRCDSVELVEENEGWSLFWPVNHKAACSKHTHELGTGRKISPDDDDHEEAFFRAARNQDTLGETFDRCIEEFGYDPDKL